MIDVELPIKLASAANMREPWQVKANRNMQQKQLVTVALYPLIQVFQRRDSFATVYRVTLTRVGRRELDSDNLQSAFKAIRDAVAGCLGRDDSEHAGIYWKYNQIKGKSYAVRVKIEHMTEKIAVDMLLELKEQLEHDLHRPITPPIYLSFSQ